MADDNITARFPAPWRIIDTGSALRIEDTNGRPLANIYYRRDEALRDQYLRHEEVLEMAKAIARLSKGS